MDLREHLKRNAFLKRLGQKINIYNSFFCDAKDFSKFYVEEANKNGNYNYSIMLLVHSLEKGMCMPAPRPFGLNKVIELISYLKGSEPANVDSFEYQLGISILHEWICFFEKHGWVNEKTYQDVKAFIIPRQGIDMKSGCKKYIAPAQDMSKQYNEVISTRSSVRDFKVGELRQEDVDFAIDCFIKTPTACNRQMCGIVYVKNPDIKKLLDERVIGLPGFNKATTHYFVITYDLQAFAYSGERQQGMLNAGMCITNFINALHAKGIGSCCLQWSNNPTEDMEMRRALGLLKSEKIAIVIGCGYYKEINQIPCSIRKPKKEIYHVL